MLLYYMFERILVATDGSETSQRAADVAVDLARVHNGEVTAVYVADVTRMAHLPDFLQFSSMFRDLMLKEGQDAVEYVEKKAIEAKIHCQKQVVEGNPSDEILRISRETRVDLLVMGSVGRGGLDRFLLGSVAEKVSQHSEVPVLLVPGKKKR